MSRGRWEDYDHSDEELNVYDQCCDNCSNPRCPMVMPETAEEHYRECGTLSDFDREGTAKKARTVIRQRKEDAVMRDGEPAWCIYWRGRRGKW